MCLLLGSMPWAGRVPGGQTGRQGEEFAADVRARKRSWFLGGATSRPIDSQPTVEACAVWMGGEESEGFGLGWNVAVGSCTDWYGRRHGSKRSLTDHLHVSNYSYRKTPDTSKRCSCSCLSLQITR